MLPIRCVTDLPTRRRHGQGLFFASWRTAAQAAGATCWPIYTRRDPSSVTKTGCTTDSCRCGGRGPGRRMSRPQRVTAPVNARAYGSSSSFAGLKRRPRLDHNGLRRGIRRPASRRPPDEPVPNPRVVVQQRDLGLLATIVEQTQQHAVGGARRHSEVRAAVTHGGAEWVRTTGNAGVAAMLAARDVTEGGVMADSAGRCCGSRRRWS